MITNQKELLIQVYCYDDNPPFICGVNGVITIGLMEEIEQDMIDNDSEIFTKGDGEYLFKATHQPGQQSFPETGQWDFPPYWELEEIDFRPLNETIAMSEGAG